MQDIAEEQNQAQIALQQILSSSHFIFWETKHHEMLHFGQVHCYLKGRMFLLTLELWLPIGGFICEEFILKEHIKSMMFLLLFFPLVYALILIFKDFLIPDVLPHWILLRESLCKDISGIFFNFFLPLNILQSIGFDIICTPNTIKDQVNNFIEIVFCKLQCSL